MSDDQPQGNERCLARIEGELREAERAFADADARFMEAERDRRVALETINRHQMEIDAAVAELRKQSIPGTKWCNDMVARDETLELEPDDIVPSDRRNSTAERKLTSDATQQALTRNFDRLRGTGEAKADDPVLKVVAAPPS